MKLRLLAGVLLAGVAFTPFSAASANTGCTHLPGRDWFDPDVVGTACYTAVGLIPDAVCTKYNICFG